MQRLCRNAEADCKLTPADIIRFEVNLGDKLSRMWWEHGKQEKEGPNEP